MLGEDIPKVLCKAVGKQPVEEVDDRLLAEEGMKSKETVLDKDVLSMEMVLDKVKALDRRPYVAVGQNGAMLVVPVVEYREEQMERSLLLASEINSRGAQMSDEPPGSTAFLAMFPKTIARLLLFSASSPIISSFTAASMFSRLIGALLSVLLVHARAPTRTPIFRICMTCNSFKNCSEESGHVSIGTPAATPSSTEFHPQPRPSILSSNPSGIHSFISSSFVCCFTTHMNCWPEASRPVAISPNSAEEKIAMLPKQTYTTELGFLELSQSKHSASPIAAAGPLRAFSSVSLLHKETGPICQAFFPITSLQYLT
nr:Os06g0343500 protein [Ipomoea batatas]